MKRFNHAQTSLCRDKISCRKVKLGLSWCREERLNFTSINKFMIAIFVCKCLESADFNNWFIHRQSGYITRDLVQQSLFVPQIRNVHSEQCVDYRGPIIWNTAPCAMYKNLTIFLSLDLNTLSLVSY